MFLSLFYLLRANRLKVSLDEWLMLMEGMRKGLHGSTLDGFYTLCRAVVVTSEVTASTRCSWNFSEVWSPKSSCRKSCRNGWSIRS